MTKTLPANPTRVMLVDDSILAREGLKAILSLDTTIILVGEAGTQAEALAAVQRHHPRVIVMDIRLADGSGIEACRLIRATCPDISILLLTSDDNEELFRLAILAGAQGYLLKGSDGDTILQAIRTLAAGQSILDPSSTTNLMSWIRQSNPNTLSTTHRELSSHDEQILFLISSGKIHDEIAKSLNVTPGALRVQLRKLFKRLNISRRSQAASYIARLEKYPHPSGLLFPTQGEHDTVRSKNQK